MKKKTELTLLISLIFIPFPILANTNLAIDDSHNARPITPSPQSQTQYLIDLGWDDSYISEGRNNLAKGGMTSSSVAIQHKNLDVYARFGRADNQHYHEWNLGFQYTLAITDNLKTTLGYQRLEIYDDKHSNDNELFGSLSYAGIEWLTPSVNYTYSTEASGYFVEASLHSSWELIDSLILTPYITQAFDFQYATEKHDGRNHFQLGIEAEYMLTQNLILSGHISHTLAQKDIKLEANMDEIKSSLDQTFTGVHCTWIF